MVKLSYLCSDEQERETYQTLSDAAQGLYLLRVEALFGCCGFLLENKGATSGSRVKFYNENDQNSYIMHKPHPSNIIKGYMMRDILNYLLKNGYIE